MEKLIALAEAAPGDLDLRAVRRRWAEPIRRIHEVGPLAPPRCGATMRIVALISEPKVIGKILTHLAVKEADGRSPPGSPGSVSRTTCP